MTEARGSPAGADDRCVGNEFGRRRLTASTVSSAVLRYGLCVTDVSRRMWRCVRNCVRVAVVTDSNVSASGELIHVIWMGRICRSSLRTSAGHDSVGASGHFTRRFAPRSLRPNNSMKIIQYITLPMCSPSVTQCTVTIHIQTWTEKFIARKKCYNAPCSRKNQIHTQLSTPTTKTIGKLQCFCIILKPTYISPQMSRHEAFRQEMNEI